MNKVQLTLTRIHLKLVGGQYQEVKTIETTDGQELEVIVFDKKGNLPLAQVTFVNTIIVNSRVFQSPQLLRYAMLHENIHQRQWYRHFILGILVVGCYVIWRLAASASPSLALCYILVSLAILLALFAFSWFIEYKAICECMKRLGMQAVLDAYKIFWPQLSRSERITHLLTHPPITLCAQICQRLNRGPTDTTEK